MAISRFVTFMGHWVPGLTLAREDNHNSELVDYEALELDKVLARLARHTAFSASRALALGMEPAGNSLPRAAVRRPPARRGSCARCDPTSPSAARTTCAPCSGALRSAPRYNPPTCSRSAPRRARPPCCAARSSSMKTSCPRSPSSRKGSESTGTVLDAIDRAIGDNGQAWIAPAPSCVRCASRYAGPTTV